MAGAADDQFDTRRYVLFMQDLAPTDQDIRLGLDQIYVEIDAQGHSGYGGIVSVTLSNERLTLILTKTAAGCMAVEDEVVALLAEEQTDLDALAESLKAMMPALFRDLRANSLALPGDDVAPNPWSTRR